MDAVANPNEVRLRKGSSLRERLVRAGVAVLYADSRSRPAHLAGGRHWLLAFWAVLLGLFLVGVAGLERNVVWIITRGGILIGEQRPLGKVHKRMIGDADIADVLRKNKFSYPASFSLACRLASGDVLISPPLPDITRVNKSAATIAGLLGFPDAAPVDNPLDAGNAEITLGSPVSPDFGRVHTILTVLVLAGLCTPFIIAFWIGKLSALGIPSCLSACSLPLHC